MGPCTIDIFLVQNHVTSWFHVAGWSLEQVHEEFGWYLDCRVTDQNVTVQDELWLVQNLIVDEQLFGQSELEDGHYTLPNATRDETEYPWILQDPLLIVTENLLHVQAERRPPKLFAHFDPLSWHPQSLID